MSTNSGMDNKAVIRGVELRLDTLVAGLTTSLPTGTKELKVGDVTYKVADLIVKANELNQPNKAKRAARAIIRQAGLTKTTDRKAQIGFLADAKVALVALLGRTNAALADFGFTPQKDARKRSTKAAPASGGGPTPTAP